MIRTTNRWEKGAVLKGKTAAGEATAALREMILSGQLHPGQPVRQNHLSELLGISRTPLRTAMATLTQDGLLSYEENRGYRVKSFSVDSIIKVFEIRAGLEAMACRAAVRCGIDNATIEELDRLVTIGDRILSSGSLDVADLPEYRQFNVRFHDTIINAAQNPWLHEFVGRTHNVPLVSDRIILWEADDFALIQRSHDDHHRIARALRNSDGERAAAIMHEHVQYAGEALVDRLRNDPEETFRKLAFSPPTANTCQKDQ